MKRIKIQINTSQQFEIWLWKNSSSLEGSWTCLPGYLPRTNGYFKPDDDDYETSKQNPTLCLYDKEVTLGDRLKAAFSSEDDEPLKIVDLERFPENPQVGMKGRGTIWIIGYKFTALSGIGHLKAVANWKIKEVY